MGEKVIKSVVKKMIAAGHACTSICDYRYRCHDPQSEWPPVFIVGAPRSGTTLIYQLMMSAFRFAYLPNVANTFYRCPITALNWGMKWCKDYQSSFSSSHGYEKGCMAPSEAGNIWNRWFPYEKREGFNYTPAGWLSPAAQREIHGLVANVERIFQAPFITKNVKMCVRVQALQEIFPNALFIHIQREMIDVILSNLVMRRSRGVSWASVMPKNIKAIMAMDEIDQVCHQIMDVEGDMMQDLKLYPHQAIFSLTYNELCESSEGLLIRLAHFFELHKVSLTTKPLSSQSFQISSPKISGIVQPDEIERIRETLRTWVTV